VCYRCRKLAAFALAIDSPGLTEKQWARAVHAYGRELKRNGFSSEKIEGALLGRDLDPRIAFAVACATELATPEAGPDEITRGLIERGVDPRVAPVVSTDAAECRDDFATNEKRDREARRCLAVGFPIFLSGAALYVGNRSGVFPTVPYAGTALMVLGGLIVAAAARAAAERIV
jgi:hypothetical protein